MVLSHFYQVLNLDLDTAPGSQVLSAEPAVYAVWFVNGPDRAAF